MYCQHCGGQLDDFATFCSRCGQRTATSQSPYSAPADDRSASLGPLLPTYLVPAILSTIFCCLPFGIVAIVYAAQVEGKQGAGDYEGALQSSFAAKRWCWISVWSWVVIFGFALIAQLLMFGFMAPRQNFNFH